MDISEDCEFPELNDLSTMFFEKYRKGYILYCPKTDSRFMMDYFMEGFWNKKMQGWFFRKQYYEKLISLGAKYIKSEDDNNSLCSYDSNSKAGVITNTRVTRSQTKSNNIQMEYVYDDY